MEKAMPTKPKHPCSYPGCPNLTDRRYCPEHEPLMSKRYEKYDRDPDKGRRYGRAWQRIRKRYVELHPFCEECIKAGVLTPVQEVHHIVPLTAGGTNDQHNLIALCKSCHSRIHAEHGRFESRPHEYFR